MTWNQKNLDYEIETFGTSKCPGMVQQTWNQKNLDYEIETWRNIGSSITLAIPWNQKNLDYEIETESQGVPSEERNGLEIKRTSITRLKPIVSTVGVDWTINLEIKRTSITRLKPTDCSPVSPYNSWLEIKRTSITRLKYGWNVRNSNDPNLLEIKRTSITRLKHLNARIHILLSALEIKRTSITRLKPASWKTVPSTDLTWNQKNLDYEIETSIYQVLCHWRSCLKSKEPRLRDWNAHTVSLPPQLAHLEIKRTSITRLKRLRRSPTEN